MRENTYTLDLPSMDQLASLDLEMRHRKKILHGFSPISFFQKNLAFICCIMVLFFLSACNNEQSKIEKALTEIEKAEMGIEEMTAEDWMELEFQMKALESDFELNRPNYSEEQVKEVGRIQGKYVALVMKKGLNDLQESVQDFGNQMKGFIEEIESDTTNN